MLSVDSETFSSPTSLSRSPIVSRGPPTPLIVIVLYQFSFGKILPFN